MSKVRLRDANLVIKGKKVFLRSGTIHYWRIKKRAWEDRIHKALRGGLNCIMSYVPWFWHEPEEGIFDLTGKTAPERDILGFIELIQEHRLYFIPRPGPFINSELKYGGHPEWIFKKYPEIYSHRSDRTKAYWVGQGTPVPSQLHPKFLELVEHWYSEVISLFSKYSIDNEGCIILIQPDNEINLVFTYGLDGSLYDRHILGDGINEGLWHRWLLEKHGSLENINKFYRTNYFTLPFVQPPHRTPTNQSELLIALDWLKFKQWHVFEYVSILSGYIEKYGLSVPFFINEPINFNWFFLSGEHGESSKYMRQKKKRCFTAGHTYLYGGEMDIFGLSAIISRVEMIKTSTLEGPPFSCEAGAGWCDFSFKGMRAYYNWDILLRVLVGHGLNGYNIFIYAGGHNPENSDLYGSDKHWDAPILPDGKINAPYHSVKIVSQFVEAWEQSILDTKKENDVTIGLFSELPLIAYPIRYYCENIDEARKIYGDDRGETKEGEFAKEIFSSIAELTRILTHLNLNFNYINLNNPKVEPNNDALKLLIVPNPGILSPEGMDFVFEYLKRGGKVLFYPTVPFLNTNLSQDDRFQNLLRCRMKEVLKEPGWSPEDIVFRVVNGKSVKKAPVGYKLYTFKKHGNVEILATFKDEICAFKQKMLNGEVVVSGIIPKYLTHTTQSLMEELIVKSFDLQRVCSSEDGIVHAVLRKSYSSGSKHTLITVANSLGQPSQMKINLKLDNGTFKFPVLSKIEIPPKTARFIWTNLNLGSFTIKYCSSELIPQNKKYTIFFASGSVGTKGEIAFDREVSLKINGRISRLIKKDGIWISTYKHGGKPTTIEVRRK